jgi:tRNA U34 5-methylaminomethyl-2-thiouridine-forming methyltransferase MnmC
MRIFEAKKTSDGSITFFSPEFEETFHTKYGAKKEAEITFVTGCNLIPKAKKKSALKIIDVCYGLGYNTAAALDAIWSINPHCHIELLALEVDERVPSQAIDSQLLKLWREPIPSLLTKFCQKKQLLTQNLKAHLFIEDARLSILKIAPMKFEADAIFLDPFSPPKCPQLWTVEFLGLIAKCLNCQGRIATYSCSAAVRSALRLAGLKIGANFCLGRRSPGTIASFTEEDLVPLSAREIEHLKTRAAIPYRDPNLRDPADIIKQRRVEEQKTSNLEPTSQWKKRWHHKFT